MNESTGNIAPDDNVQHRDVRAVDPMTGLPMGAGSSAGSGPASGEDDPDGQGLPPNVILPDANAFKRDQLRARLLVSLVALGVLGVIVFLSDEHRTLYSLCAGGAALAVLVLGVRYMVARANAKANTQANA